MSQGLPHAGESSVPHLLVFHNRPCLTSALQLRTSYIVMLRHLCDQLCIPGYDAVLGYHGSEIQDYDARGQTALRARLGHWRLLDLLAASVTSMLATWEVSMVEFICHYFLPRRPTGSCNP